MGNWLLPEHVADILPAETRRIEDLRRRLLDLYRSYGYELVMPPLVEYLESLLSGTGHDLEESTFKLVDPLSGRLLGVRADITPQVTRIDAHLLNRQGVTRLCYCGSVLNTRPSGFWSTREPLQIGAELYGHAGAEADLEIMELALASLERAGLDSVRIDLCHPGVVRALIQSDAAAMAQAPRVFALLRAKNVSALTELDPALASDTRRSLETLARLYGGRDIIEQARRELPSSPALSAALDHLQAVAALLPDQVLSIDLADVRGYQYHTGVMFAVYSGGWPNALVRGGRYDHVGRAFGRSRPATGFSLDLRELSGLLPPAAAGRAIRAPWCHDPALRKRIAELRAQGEVVVQALPGHEHDHEEFVCDRELVAEQQGWVIRPLPGANPAAAV
jgi:ATP phosphoribosyltransferase regulatory subunit